MNRTYGGEFTIGGGLSLGKDHYGDVASVVVTTLKRGVAMPDEAEATMMIRDPSRWVAEYKVGESYRPSNQNYNNANFQIGDTTAAASCLYYEMGDGASDSFTNGIRNYCQPGNVNMAMLFQNMQSNDIVNVSIPGLS